MELMSGKIAQGEEMRFNGLLLYTCENLALVMGCKKYDSYCKEFGIRPAIRPTPERNLRGI